MIWYLLQVLDLGQGRAGHEVIAVNLVAQEVVANNVVVKKVFAANNLGPDKGLAPRLVENAIGKKKLSLLAQQISYNDAYI